MWPFLNSKRPKPNQNLNFILCFLSRTLFLQTILIYYTYSENAYIVLKAKWNWKWSQQWVNWFPKGILDLYYGQFYGMAIKSGWIMVLGLKNASRFYLKPIPNILRIFSRENIIGAIKMRYVKLSLFIYFAFLVLPLFLISRCIVFTIPIIAIADRSFSLLKAIANFFSKIDNYMKSNKEKRTWTSTKPTQNVNQRG